jgi:hypothetical protein
MLITASTIAWSSAELFGFSRRAFLYWTVGWRRSIMAIPMTNHSLARKSTVVGSRLSGDCSLVRAWLQRARNRSYSQKLEKGGAGHGSSIT